ncbi:MAG: DNA replication/repair protein RecF [Lentimicrobiaceae bacterium]|nr:DNA replication/repair protein RecF [Lentimicrobiaceae bacterium]
MYLKNIHLINFKNFEEDKIDFSQNVNCFTGNNGVGKTNILDAIYHLSFTKSYFYNSDLHSIRHDESFFAVHGNFVSSSEELPQKVSCILSRGKKKQMRLNDKEYDRISDHIGRFPCVMVSPYDRDIIREGSLFRRRFFDMVISQFDAVYLDNLMRYNKLMLQRNAILKKNAEIQSSDYSLLQLIDIQMVAPATDIYTKRKDFIEKFLPLFKHYFNIISNGKESVDIEYSSHLNDTDFEKLLSENFERDLFLKYTSKGVHKDDFIFYISDNLVKQYASQGQQKSFAISLKLAQFDYTRQRIKHCPLLLLDDIFDKLDHKRVQQLINLVLNDNFGQVFITDTDKERIKKMLININRPYKLFDVKDNKTEIYDSQ